MKSFGKLTIGVLSAAMLLSTAFGLAACGGNGNNPGKTPGGDPTEIPTQIVNGGFEENKDESTWTGWTKSGTAFSARGVISGTSVNGVEVDKTGEKFFSGLDGGTQKMTGTLRSDVFRLTGTGKVAFKMGAAKHGDKVYVQFFEDGKEEPLATVTNTDFDGTWITDQLIRKIVDLSAHVGKNLYILVTDEDNNDDFGYISLDDFVVCLTEEDVTKYETERTQQLARFGEPVFEEDETSTTIQNPGFETGDLTGWKLLEGTAITDAGVVPTSQYYWTDRAVYGNGDYYFDGNDNGAIIESTTGAIRSSKFTLGGDGYIAFKIGAGGSNCFVQLCDAATDEVLIQQRNTAFSDPKTALMLLRYYMDASEYLGKVVYMKIVDNNSGGGFAFICVDDFHVSMTEQDVRDLQVEDYQRAMNETYTGKTYDDIPTLQDYYRNYKYLFPLDVLKFTALAEDVVMSTTEEPVDLNDYIEGVEAALGTTAAEDISIVKVTCGDREFTTGFDAFDLSNEGTYVVTYRATLGGESVEESFKIIAREGEFNVTNGDFETGDLAGWTPLTEGWSQTGGKYDGVSNAEKYWDEELPFNKSGTYFLNGWDNGVPETQTWELRSTDFVLGGSGWISVKMGGAAAAVRVYKAADDSLIGFYKQTRFTGDKTFPNVGDGKSAYADMANYAIDLSEYLGEKLYVVLCDISVNTSWAHAFFDDVVTYYETAPDWEHLYDEVLDGHKNGKNPTTPGMVRISWVLAVNALVRNSGFETGDLTGWTPQTEGWGSNGENGVYSDPTWWGDSQAPYNQSGNYHLDGWHTGIDENGTWTVRSSTFMLLGSGWITVKMAGHAAAVKVYLAEDDTLIGYYKQTRFKDEGFPLVGDGNGSWADMAVYAIDLSEYVGQKLYIELCDERTSGWAHAFFDDVITYYEEAPDWENNYDEVYQSEQKDVPEDEKVKVQIKWVLAVNLVTPESSDTETENTPGEV